jgi:hypothetical protein
MLNLKIKNNKMAMMNKIKIRVNKKQIVKAKVKGKMLSYFEVIFDFLIKLISFKLQYIFIMLF